MATPTVIKIRKMAIPARSASNKTLNATIPRPYINGHNGVAEGLPLDIFILLYRNILFFSSLSIVIFFSLLFLSKLPNLFKYFP